MATSFITFNPSTLSAATSCKRDPNNNNNRKPFSTSWFTPLFGWPNTPGYIESAADTETEADGEAKAAAATATRSRFMPLGFTDEKAKQLRMMTSGKESFHDAMYHSAIASRLASDFSSKSDY